MSKTLRALLIWPKFESFSFWNFEEVCRVVGTKYMTPPLGLITVAAMLPDTWELRVVDENVRMIEERDIDWADVVLIGSKIVHRQRALNLVRWARRLGKPVVVGGPDPTLSDAIYRSAGANYVCVGEGELVIDALIEAIESGAADRVFRAMGQCSLEETPVPRFDLIDLNDYLYVGIQYSRGCPYNCEFCNVIDIFDKYKTKTPDQVLLELDSLYAQGYRGQVDFFDDNFAGHLPRAKTVLRALRDWLKAHNYPFTFSTSVTLNIAKDDELLNLLREARFKALLVGIETPNPEVLKAAQKPQNIGFSIADAIDRIYTIAGATVHSGFLLGLDGEPSDIGKQITQCIDDTSIPWVMAGIVYPLPGTQLSRRLEREGRLFPSARVFDDERVRDQISAGLQFEPERPARDVIQDLLTVLQHSFDPKGYFSRCAHVATRLNTVPKLYLGGRIFRRNIGAFFRLCWRVTTSRALRRPFWKAFWKVIFRNLAGLEALIMLSVLYLHFRKMLPYCYDQLALQLADIDRVGADKWLESRLQEDNEGPATSSQSPAQPRAAA